MTDPIDQAKLRRERHRASKPERKPVITWHLPALLGGILVVVFGIIRPAVCWEAWQVRAASDPILERLETRLKEIGVKPVEDERRRGFCG